MEAFEETNETVSKEETRNQDAIKMEPVNEAAASSVDGQDTPSPLSGQDDVKQEIPPEILPFLSNPYVDSFQNGKLFYKPGFHKALFENLEAGLNAKEAYDALGFDTKVLGYDRAYGAAKRAREKAMNGTLDTPIAEAEVIVEEEAKAQEQPEWLEEVLQNPYVRNYSIEGGRIHYTSDFYAKMAELLEEGNTAVQAYKALGFPVDKLGQDRANQAASYAKKMAGKKARPIVGTNGYSGKKSLTEILDDLDMDAVDPNNPQFAAAVLARTIYLETIIDQLKKKEIMIPGQLEPVELILAETDKNPSRTVDRFIDKNQKRAGLSLSDCLRAFEVNSSTYSSYKAREKKRQKEEEGRLNKEAKEAKERRRKEYYQEEREYKLAILQVVHMFSGICPGIKRMKLYLNKLFDIKIGRKRVGRLMREMNLIVGEIGKGNDPYKKQATHEHPSLAEENHVAQNFVRAPFNVVLTDITYCFYDYGNKVAYLCEFYEPFMNKPLGYCVSKTMDVELIKTAYERMMNVYGDDLKNVSEVYVHSDQGSQYTATSFKELLKRDGFIQSMSRRGTPLDNAPMEASFSRLKNDLRYLMNSCKTFEALEDLIGGYLENEDKNRAYLCLAGLSPAEYYSYWKTGIYPLESYFGVDWKELHSVEDFIEYRKKVAEENREKNAAKKANYNAQSTANVNSMMQTISDPKYRVTRDLQEIKHAVNECKNSKDNLDKVLDKLNELLEMVKEAKTFIQTASKGIIDELKTPKNWQKYKELRYINHMAENGIY